MHGNREPGSVGTVPRRQPGTSAQAQLANLAGAATQSVVRVERKALAVAQKTDDNAISNASSRNRTTRFPQHIPERPAPTPELEVASLRYS